MQKFIVYPFHWGFSFSRLDSDFIGSDKMVIELPDFFSGILIQVSPKMYWLIDIDSVLAPLFQITSGSISSCHCNYSSSVKKDGILHWTRTFRIYFCELQNNYWSWCACSYPIPVPFKTWKFEACIIYYLGHYWTKYLSKINQQKFIKRTNETSHEYVTYTCILQQFMH